MLKHALIISFVFALIFPLRMAANSSLGGLYFYSHQQIKEKRTSLELNPERPFVLNGGFTLRFDMKIRNENSIFGYIFRIIANDSINIDLLTSHSEGKDVFWFVVGSDKKELIPFQNIPKYKRETWFHVRLTCIPSSSIFLLSLNNKQYKLKLNKSLPMKDRFRFYFGKVDVEPYLSTDVCPMIIRDVRIFDSSGKTQYDWSLVQHGEKYVYDKIVAEKAVVNNPKWLIDSHIRWRAIDSLRLNDKPQVAFNSVDECAYIALRSSLYRIRFMPEAVIDTLPVRSGSAYNSLPNQLLYNTYTQELWSYDINNPQISKYNFNQCRWSLDAGEGAEPSYWHHNAIFSPYDSMLYCIGGYGFHTYHKEILRYNGAQKKWENVGDLKNMHPRYLASIGLVKDKILIYGGFGSKTGEQQVSPHSFNDLHRINVKDMEDELCWSNSGVDGVVHSQSLVADPQNTHVYTLGYSGKNYNTKIRLYKIGLEEGEQIELGDSIAYQFSDTESFCDLYYLKQSKQFVAVTLHKELSNNYIVKYFVLDAPALPVIDIIQTENQLPVFYNVWWIWSIIVFIGLGAIVGCMYYMRRKKQTTEKVIVEQPDTADIANASLSTPLQKPSLRPSSILLLGGFQAINKRGEDVTGIFSPILKNLLLLIILYTQKNNRGVASSMLQETLWFDKSESSARNNKNVNLHKLKLIMDEFEGISLHNETSYWRIEVTDPGLCDYLSVWHQAMRVQKGETLSHSDLLAFIPMVSVGTLLPNVQNEWVDPFKADYTSAILNSLHLIAKRLKGEEQWDKLILVTDAILLQDSIDEDAIAYKCTALIRLGRKSAAISAYNYFAKEYKNILGCNPTVLFDEME